MRHEPPRRPAPSCRTRDAAVGIAIAVHDASACIEACLRELGDESLRIVLFDDGSRDGTREIARRVRPDIHVKEGSGDAWFGGGTAAAVDACFGLGCDYVVMLNPDTLISGEDVRRLVEYAAEHPRTIVAALVVEQGREDVIAWAGSRQVRLWPLPIYTQRYVRKRGSAVSSVGSEPYEVDEAHARAVVVSREVYEEIGTLDWKTFPHYGSDSDYSLRARARGIRIVVLPAVRARLAVDNSGMAFRSRRWSRERLREIRDYLTRQKNGDALRVLWRLHRRHLPRHAVIPSYLFNLALGVVRRAARP